MKKEVYQTLQQYLTNWTFPNGITEKDKKKIQGMTIRYHVKNNLLYRKNKKDHHQPLRVVRRSEVLPLIKRLHEDPLSGHFGIESTYK